MGTINKTALLELPIKSKIWVKGLVELIKLRDRHIYIYAQRIWDCQAYFDMNQAIFFHKVRQMT